MAKLRTKGSVRWATKNNQINFFANFNTIITHLHPLVKPGLKYSNKCDTTNDIKFAFNVSPGNMYYDQLFATNYQLFCELLPNEELFTKADEPGEELLYFHFVRL